MDTIKQIIPADGWYAAFSLMNLRGWHRQKTPQSVNPVSETQNLAGFVAPGELAEDTAEKACHTTTAPSD